jgi:anti-sigma regulatory factor (Ser/Thr protein kinase)
VDDELTWSLEEHDTAVTLVVRGSLTRRSGSDLDRVLRKVLLDRGRLVVDVSQVRVQWRPALAVFATALASAGGWPLARLVIVDAEGDVGAALRAGRGGDGVILVADRAAGWHAMDRRPARVSRASELPRDATAPGYARALVREACAEWAVDGELDRILAVANELVTNAVEHAGGGLVLHLSHDRRGLTVGVRDGSVWAGGVPEAQLDPEGEQFGLRIVAGLSDNWGVLRHDDGKTVWARLRPDPAGGQLR